jgi:hypothetical protein
MSTRRSSEPVFSSRLSSMVVNDTDENESDSDDEIHVHHHTHKPPVYRRPKPKRALAASSKRSSGKLLSTSTNSERDEVFLSVDDINRHIEHIQQYTFTYLQKSAKVPTYATKHQRCHRCRVVYGPPALPDFVI